MSLEGRIVFASGRACDFDLWLLDLKTGGLSQLTHGRKINDQPVWSPDGQQIAFVATGEDMIPSLCVMRNDGGETRRLTEGLYCQHPSWDTSGERIIFCANPENGSEVDICAYSMSSNSYEKLFSRKGVEREPCVSPDGKSILFASIHPKKKDKGVQGFNTDIFEYDIGTGSEQVIHAHPARDYCPVYSPDGTKIAFVSHREGLSLQKYQSAVDNIRLCAEEKDWQAVDAAIRTVQKMEQDSDIFIMNRDGSELRQITENSGADNGFSWSPCGSYIVYTSSVKGASGSERLKVVETATGNAVPLEYDRTPLEKDINADPNSVLNQTIFQKILPDALERKLVAPSFWGEEREPTWTYHR